MSKYILFCLFIFSSIIGFSQTANITGVIRTHSGTLIPNVTVTLKSINFERRVLTDETGRYLFSEVPTGAIYTVEPELEGVPVNGVSTFDLVQMLDHIGVFMVLETDVEQLAADLDQSGTVSVRDAWLLRNLILGVSTTLDVPTWRFVPLDYSYPDAITPQTFTLGQNTENINFFGVKAGDVNGSDQF